uniref:RING-type E3 ubiquitin transferase n=2 Tax=Tetraselmis sp. GSL018 TaxID=582737 RepID=A0A061S412_9CHLO
MARFHPQGVGQVETHPLTGNDVEQGLSQSAFLDMSLHQNLEPTLNWSYLQSQQSAVLFNAYRIIMGIMLFCLFMGTLPAVALVWVAITCILFMTFMRVFFWQHVNNLVADWDLSMLQGPEAARGQRVAAGGGGGLLMALGSGGGGGGAPRLDLLNLRLSLVDRDFNADDYEVLLGLDQGAALSNPRSAVTDAHLAALPVHLYPGHGGGGGGRGRRRVDRAGLLLSLSGAAQDARSDALQCSVCLDEAAEGEKIMTLPCHHQFHADCIRPWLKQQGLQATCPICKLRVFA